MNEYKEHLSEELLRLKRRQLELTDIRFETMRDIVKIEELLKEIERGE